MASPVVTFDVDFDGVVRTIEVKKIDLVRAEKALHKSVSRMDELGDMYALAWSAMRRLKIENVPDTLEAFLDAEPDVDVIDNEPGGDAVGKGSTETQPTG